MKVKLPYGLISPCAGLSKALFSVFALLIDSYPPLFLISFCSRFDSLKAVNLKDGYPDDDGAFTLRTVYLLFVGDGKATMFSANSSIGRPRVLAILSNSSSFSTAS